MGYVKHSAADATTGHPGPTYAESACWALADAYLAHREARYGTPAYAPALELLEHWAKVCAAYRTVENYDGSKTRGDIAIALVESEKRTSLRFSGLCSAEDHAVHMAEYIRLHHVYNAITDIEKFEGRAA
jgi:hypothetical protein